MRKLYFIIAFVSYSVFAQTSMTFTGTSYMYVKDRFVFVKNGIDLKANTNIYLRKEAQLLQGRVGTTQNAGPGKLSVYQEGTSGPYSYNFWCSPVGNTLTASGNETFGITLLSQPTDNINSTPAANVSAPNYNGSSNPLTIANYWIWKYNPGLNYSDWDFVGNATTIAAGEGFTMKGTSGDDTSNTALIGEATDNNPTGVDAQRYDFRGRPNDGDILIPVLASNETLTGNPYPSAIDLKAFLTDAINTAYCDGIAYFYENDKSVLSHNVADYKAGWGIYSPIGGVSIAPHGNMGIYTPAPFFNYNGSGVTLGPAGTGGMYQRRFCPIGQGFAIKGVANGNVTMKDSYRVYQKEGAANYSQFERTADSNSDKTVNDTNTAGFLPEIPSVSGFDYTTVSTAEVPQIRFNGMMNNQGIRQTVVALVPGASDGYENGMEAQSIDGLQKDYYFAVDNKECVINVIDFDINKKIPLGIRNNTATNFKFTVNQMINFETPNVYVHDKVNDTYTDIVNGLFEVNLPAGVNNTQFEITFTNSTLAINNNNVSNFTVFQNNDKELLNIANPNKIEINNVILYDVVGKVIFDKKETSSKDAYQFSTSTYSDGVYIVKIISKDNKEFSQKVIISNTK